MISTQRLVTRFAIVVSSSGLLAGLAFVGAGSSPAQAANAACAPTSSTASGVVTLTFATTGTCDWAVPAGVSQVDVVVVGAGGGGSGGTGDSLKTYALGANGGGGGNVNVDTNFSVPGSGSVTVVVGTGGAGGAGGAVGGAGSAGGSSSFDSVSASGGGGGASPSASDKGQTRTAGGGSGSSVDGAPVSYSGGLTAAPGTKLSGSLEFAPGGAGAGAGAVGGVATATGSGTNSIGGTSGNGGQGFLPSTGLFAGYTTYYGGGGGGGVFGSGNSQGKAYPYAYPTLPRTEGGGADSTMSANALVLSGPRYQLDAAPSLGGGGAGGSANAYPPMGAPSEQYRGGNGGSGVIVVRYTAPVPSLSPSSQTVNGVKSFAITPTTAFTPAAFSGSPSYAISPALPAGLTMNSSTGVVSGTPTVTLSSTAFTVTGTYLTETATSTLTISVIAPSLSPATQTVVTEKDAAMSATSTFTASDFGSGAVSYAVSPTLPTGLSLDPNTGVITGTPTAVLSATTYTITATGTNGTATATVSITVAVPSLSPATQTVSLASDALMTSTSAMTPTLFGGSVTYTVSPTLPAGLSISSSTGEVSGTPTASQSATVYTVTGTGATSGTATATITITIAPPSIAPATQSISTPVNVAMTSTSAMTPTLFGGSVTYTVSPTLPVGLSISSSTGVVSGTPTASQPATVYTVTGTGATSGTATATITITVSDPPAPTPEPTTAPTPTASASPRPLVPPLAPVVNSVTQAIPPGKGVVTENGVEIPVTLAPTDSSHGMQFTAADWSLSLAGLLPDGSRAPLNTQGQLVIDEGRGLRTGGTGFAAGTDAKVYLLPPVVTARSGSHLLGRAGVALTAPLLLGTVPVGTDGTFVGTLPVPLTVPPGDYISQVVGYSPAMQARTASLGVVLSADKKSVVKRVATTVYFASGSPALDSTAKARLAVVSKRIPRSATNVNVQSIGYVQGTTFTGNDLKLSTARAANTAAQLKLNGIRGKSYVSGRGVAKEPGARARRVEVVIAYTLSR